MTFPFLYTSNYNIVLLQSHIFYTIHALLQHSQYNIKYNYFDIFNQINNLYKHIICILVTHYCGISWDLRFHYYQLEYPCLSFNFFPRYNCIIVTYNHYPNVLCIIIMHLEYTSRVIDKKYNVTTTPVFIYIRFNCSMNPLRFNIEYSNQSEDNI